MSELQDLFEQSNPIPKGITRCGDHYAQTEYMLIDPYASNYAARFKGFMEGVRHQQAIIDQLNSVLDERTKEWLQAIECGTYFENVAKPLKEENDRLKAQLNNMEACYIEKKKQVESCVALVGEWRETHIGGWSDYARGSLHSRQDCINDLEKALRGEP